MKSIIRRILKEEKEQLSYFQKIKRSRLKGFVDKHMEKQVEEHGFNIDVADIVNELTELLAVDYQVVYFLIFTFFIENGEDPTSHFYLPNWTYKSDPMDFLKSSGYYDTIDVKSFYDVDITEDGKVLLKLDGWTDFAPLFQERDLAERVMDEDWLDLFDMWGYTDLEEIIDSLDNKAFRYVVDHIIEKNKGGQICGLSHRDEFDGLMDEDGCIDIDNEENQSILRSLDNYNLHILIEESSFEGNNDLIHELKSAYNTSYNGAAEDELFSQHMEEIVDYFGNKPQWEGEDLVVDITNRYKTLMDKYIEELGDDPTYQHSGFMDMLNYLFEQYSGDTLSSPDTNYYHPDSDKVKEHMSDNVVNYVGQF